MLRFSICILLGTLAFPSLSMAAPLKLGPRKDVTITPKSDGVSEIVVTGKAPHFWSGVITEADPKKSVLAFDYFSSSGIDSVSIRFRGSDGEMVFAGSKPMPLAETWQPFAIELSEPLPQLETRLHISLKYKKNARFQIRGFQLREPTEEEIRLAENLEKTRAHRQADADALVKHLRTDFPATISSVAIDREKINISGSSPIPVSLVEVPPQLPSHLPSPRPLIAVENPLDFKIELPRIDPQTKRDRANSRWRLVDTAGKIQSHSKWPTTIQAAESGGQLNKLQGKSQKGIGGVPQINSPDHPIFELDVDHATMNVVLNGLLYTTKRPGLQPIEFEGKTYFLNPRFLTGKDQTLRALCSKNIIVTCILLVGNHKDSLLRHPAAESRGTYAMPNLATAEGAHFYRAAIHFLAKRYSTPGMRISNWVIHNEVDQAGTWTNMGDQPMPRYLESYARSARLVYHTARQYDPHARVFMSLTHHWTKQSSGNGTYVVRDMIDLFSEIADVEGNFDWGVAYHPYPRGLRNPDTWDDEDVTFEFDTPYITPKNLEVLPAYLGPNRPILFSEQGFNTPTLSEADQKRQVAGLIYTYRKLRQMPTVEAYHLHRFQDMPDREGGLRLGIMDENGNRKLGWHAYAAIGTEAENKHAKIADELLPPTEPIRKLEFYEPTGSVR